MREISIHAPTRGATVTAFFPIATFPISIHAPTRGATHLPLVQSAFHIFQSTLPREERRIRCIFTLIFRNFNPRSHERSDHIQRAFRQTCHISIHAPTRGATRPAKDWLEVHKISIHAPTRGATSIETTSVLSSLFQSTLPREERQQYCTKNLFIFIQYRQ